MNVSPAEMEQLEQQLFSNGEQRGMPPRRVEFSVSRANRSHFAPQTICPGETESRVRAVGQCGRVVQKHVVGWLDPDLY